MTDDKQPSVNCDHDWEVIHDWEGDPGVIGGTHDFCYLRCCICGEENYELNPADYASDFEDWD